MSSVPRSPNKSYSQFATAIWPVAAGAQKPKDSIGNRTSSNYSQFEEDKTQLDTIPVLSRAQQARSEILAAITFASHVVSNVLNAVFCIVLYYRRSLVRGKVLTSAYFPID